MLFISSPFATPLLAPKTSSPCSFFPLRSFVELPLVAFMRVQILSPILRFLLGPSCLFPPLLPMSSLSEVNRKPPVACFVLKICIGQCASLSSFPSFSNFIKMALGWHFFLRSGFKTGALFSSNTHHSTCDLSCITC